MSTLTVELIPDLEVGGFTARAPDIPAYGEGETEEDAIADLKEALAAYVEAFGLADAVARLNPPQCAPPSKRGIGRFGCLSFLALLARNWLDSFGRRDSRLCESGAVITFWRAGNCARHFARDSSGS